MKWAIFVVLENHHQRTLAIPKIYQVKLYNIPNDAEFLRQQDDVHFLVLNING